MLWDQDAHTRTLVPTIAFIDPFGYSTASMSLAGRLLAFPRCEALIFLPLSFIHRFVGRDGQEAALTSLFGCEDAMPSAWRAKSDVLSCWVSSSASSA